jgi:adenylate cyclase
MLRLRFPHEGEVQVVPLVGEEIHVGRGGDNDVVLSDFSVSRHHAALRAEGDGWYIYDLQSTNGVQVNGVSVKRGAIRPGDQLRVGIFELLVESEQPTPSPAPADVPSQHLVEPASGPPTTLTGSAEIPAATIVRSLADFSAEFERQITETDIRLDKRKALDQAYSNRIFSFLTRLARDLITTESVDDVLARVIDISFQALPVERGFILLEDERGQIVPELARIGARIERRPRNQIPVSQTILETVMRDRVALLTLDALDDQRLAGGESIRIHGIRSAMCAPLWSEENIIGFMQVDSPFHAGTFTEQDLDFLIALANYAAVAVERIRERRVRGRLERYHSPAVIEEVMREEEGTAEVRGLKKAEVTALFADLVGFTAFAESARLEEVAELLTGYCTRSVDAIFAAGGTLDKFMGDCVMAFFGAPMSQPDHALRGVQAAIAIQNALDEWNLERRQRGLFDVYCRVGINSGPVVVGDVGSELRVDYTVLGNAVNLASRLEENVAGPGEIVVGESTRNILAGEIPLEPLGEFELKGLQQKVSAYRVIRQQ